MEYDKRMHVPRGEMNTNLNTALGFWAQEALIAPEGFSAGLMVSRRLEPNTYRGLGALLREATAGSYFPDTFEQTAALLKSLENGGEDSESRQYLKTRGLKLAAHAWRDLPSKRIVAIQQGEIGRASCRERV